MIDIIYNDNNSIVRITGVIPGVEVTQNGDLLIRDSVSSPYIILAFSSGQWEKIERSVDAKGECKVNIRLFVDKKY